jgi:hypothetical protein
MPRLYEPDLGADPNSPFARDAFDYAQGLLAVKSPSEFIELSTARMCNQFDIVSAQNKELCVLAQKVATDVAEPITTGMSGAPRGQALR